MDHPHAESFNRGHLGKLLAKVEEERGLDMTQYRQPYVERRIASRLRSLNIQTYRQYARYLDDHPEEYVKLLDTLTINVTDFFRDPPVFDYFCKKVVPEIIERKSHGRQRMLRVWSAGCATGEEPYSLAMSFLDAIEGSHFVLALFGTDIDPEALTKAEKGVYDVKKYEHIPKRYRDRYTVLHGDTFEVTPELKNHVRFKQLNLFTDQPLAVVDVIFCRNVFIYFTREQQRRVIDIFHDSLSRGGYLVLGRSEKMSSGMSDRFEPVSGRDRIYRKCTR